MSPDGKSLLRELAPRDVLGPLPGAPRLGARRTELPHDDGERDTRRDSRRTASGWPSCRTNPAATRCTSAPFPIRRPRSRFRWPAGASRPGPAMGRRLYYRSGSPLLAAQDHARADLHAAGAGHRLSTHHPSAGATSRGQLRRDAGRQARPRDPVRRGRLPAGRVAQLDHRAAPAGRGERRRK